MLVIVDSACLNQLCHPRLGPEFTKWFYTQVLQQDEVTAVVPEVVDYEVRRGYLFKSRLSNRNTSERAAFMTSLEHLDRVAEMFRLLGTTTEVLYLAAELWADARGRNLSGAHEQRIDIDVIVAAHAISESAAVLTTNRRHFEHFGIEILEPNSSRS